MIDKIPDEKIVRETAEKEATQVAPSPQELEPDLSADLECQKADYQVATLQQELLEAQDTHGLRLGYTGRIFWLVVAWLALVIVAVYLSGFGIFGFRLSDSVIIAFITSTTVNVVGLFYVVAKWMFPTKKDKKII